MKTSEIKFLVTLDEEKIPSRLEWEATDSGIEGRKPCNATMMSIWDPKENTTLRIDLWTKDMLVDDMKRFFYENFVTMADTYLRATNDPQLAGEIRQFAEAFGKKIAESAGK
ncbi:MAG: gliding motility protein GldC [Bacteroidetes bacterium]|nr:gliding motility protein GldC [Bacteroidota bacterium]MBL0065904.1 gliding motility protein GldC [Bacteroidota bacterium]MBL0137972.1 gliding motility protein GldC [Bacteroidota bacterium]